MRHSGTGGSEGIQHTGNSKKNDKKKSNEVTHLEFGVIEYSFKGYLLRVHYMPETFLDTGGYKT